MKIFALDSSSNSASVALGENGKIIGEFYADTGFTHSRTLMPMINSLYESAGLSVNDMDLFVCCTGPGSFTGVRIGVSTVKAMALSTDKPCIGMSSLETMAYNGLICDDCIIVSSLDARREQLYNAVFYSKDGSIKRLCEDRVIYCKDLINELKEKYFSKRIIMVGNGSDLCYNVWDGCDLNLSVAPANLKYCSASGMILNVEKNFKNLSTTSANLLNPTYLRMSQAQRELCERQNKV